MATAARCKSGTADYPTAPTGHKPVPTLSLELTAQAAATTFISSPQLCYIIICHNEEEGSFKHISVSVRGCLGVTPQRAVTFYFADSSHVNLDVNHALSVCLTSPDSCNHAVVPGMRSCITTRPGEKCFQPSLSYTQPYSDELIATVPLH
ncbi:uncharacterized protein V6R79_012872 [Siganus canaliculatus]